MGISLKKWLIGKLIGDNEARADPIEITCAGISSLSQEVMIRELAFNSCINMIANAVGKCRFKTYQNYKEYKGQEWYLWNYEPNKNQNSSAFIHKLIYELFKNNEALIVTQKAIDGRERMYVADSYSISEEYPGRETQYSGVVVGSYSYTYPFYENQVMHFKLNNENIKPVLDGLYNSYYQLISAALENYSWGSGKHLKVHVDQIIRGDSQFAETFQTYLDNQVKPWLESKSGVLPEFDGYTYTNLGGNPDTQRSTRDIRSLMDDIFNFTANAFGIPPVLLLGDVAGTQDAMTRWLTTCIDPLCDQLQEEITRKRYGFDNWRKGNFLQIDTSSIVHFDMFANATNIEKLIGSGAYSIDDVREAAGMQPINEDWSTKHFLTLNISTIEKAAQAAEGNITEGGE